MKPCLTAALRAWQTQSFANILREELEDLPVGTLPLLNGASRGGIPDDRDIKVMLLSVVEAQDAIQARVGIFFNEIMAGCSCGDEPLALNSYCELQVSIDKDSAEATFTVLGG